MKILVPFLSVYTADMQSWILTNGNGGWQNRAKRYINPSFSAVEKLHIMFSGTGCPWFVCFQFSHWKCAQIIKWIMRRHQLTSVQVILNAALHYIKITVATCGGTWHYRRAVLALACLHQRLTGQQPCIVFFTLHQCSCFIKLWCFF